MNAGQDPSAAAEQARTRLHEEIERVRVGVEEMLAEQGSAGDADLARELDDLRRWTRRYVKRRVRRARRRVDGRVAEVEERLSALERRLEQAEQERQYAEWRIHTNTEQMLDGLLREIKAIADLLSRTR